MNTSDLPDYDDDLLVELLRRYQIRGQLVLHDRHVIGERIYDPAVYMLVHYGRPIKEREPT
jgi:hypothetical protein